MKNEGLSPFCHFFAIFSEEATFRCSLLLLNYFWQLEIAEQIRDHPWAMGDLNRKCILKHSCDFIMKQWILSLFCHFFAISSEQATFVCFLQLLNWFWQLKIAELIREHPWAMSDWNHKCCLKNSCDFIMKNEGLSPLCHFFAIFSEEATFRCSMLLLNWFWHQEIVQQIKDHPWAMGDWNQKCFLKNSLDFIMKKWILSPFCHFFAIHSEQPTFARLLLLPNWFWWLEIAEQISDHPWAMGDLNQKCFLKCSLDFIMKQWILSPFCHFFAISFEEATLVCSLLFLNWFRQPQFAEQSKEHPWAMND